MKAKVDGCFLLLDGSERQVAKTLREAGLEGSEICFPMLPDASTSRRTVWWASAARLFNAFKAKGQGNKVFYWGPRRFLRLFLREACRWDGGTPVLWSHWERAREDGVLRFYGALGACLPDSLAREMSELPVYLGNRFFAEAFKEALARAGYDTVCCGRAWPSPQEELGVPKGNQRITLAMIVKDEEEFLSGCLEQALPFVEAIVVVDTGSRDRTPEIAERYGVRLLRNEWRADFAAARNTYLEEIREGWVLTLDADEYLTPEAGAWLRRLAEQGEPKVYYLRTYNYQNEFLPHFSDQANIRLFWRSGDIRYAGEIHEQLITTLPRELVGGPYVLHYGYLPGVIAGKKKPERNAGILEEITEKKDSPFDWYNLGLTLMAMNKPEEALRALEQYLGLESPEAVRNRPSALWHAARAALACGKKEQALEYAKTACEAPLPECYFTKAQVLEALGRTDEAIAAYREAAALPDPPASLYQIFNQTDSTIKLWRASLAAASLLEKEKRYAEAEREYKQVLESDVANVFALLGVARTKRLQGRPREAIKWARRAIEAQPFALEPHAEYLEVLLAAGSLSEAGKHIACSELSASLKHGLWLRLAGTAAEAENWPIALEASEKALEHGSTEVSAFVIKTRSLKELGRLDEAEEVLKAAPAHPEVENERGCLALAKGLLDTAEVYFRGALTKDPTHRAAATNLAQVLVLKGKVEEALDIVYPFATFSEDKLFFSKAAFLAARCLNSLKRYVESLNLLSLVDAAALKPGELFELNVIKGNAHFGLEQWLEAADCYFEAYRLNPNDPELLYRIGLLMLKLERWEDAENAFLSAIQADPGNQEANNFLQIARHMRLLVQGRGGQVKTL